MPSFFYHLVFDIHRYSPSVVSPIFEVGSRSLWSPFKARIRGEIVGQGEEKVRASHTGRSPLGSHQAVSTVSACSPRQSESNPSNVQLVTSDWRYNKVLVERVDMTSPEKIGKHENNKDGASRVSHEIMNGPARFATKGRFEPLSTAEEELGWGVVRLYRDSEETPGLYDDAVPIKEVKTGRGFLVRNEGDQTTFKDEDCTTLCVLAVPSYLTPSDFLGFVGEKTREEVSHFRMIKSERNNRYMVLMKFRSGKKARIWRKEWNGKAFDGMEVGLHTDGPARLNKSADDSPWQA